MAVKNMAASVLTRLKNQAKEERIPFQLVLQLFAQEEFLRKLPRSEYADHFVLKGGMFIYTLTEFQSRPTKDIDFLLRDLHGSMENIEQTMKNICAIGTGNDFIQLEVIRTEKITLEKKYPGVKTTLLGKIGKVRMQFSIDVGIDDVIVPAAVERAISTRLPDFEAPKLYTYSLESTIAEKFDAILLRMAGTSRMKDFYDIYYLSEMVDYEGQMLAEALQSTLEHRGRAISEDVFAQIRLFTENAALLTQWKAFAPAKEVGLSFEAAINRLEQFLEPVYRCILLKSDFEDHWSCKSRQWQRT